MADRRHHRWEAFGTVVVFQHCTFHWAQPFGRWQRFVPIETGHCTRCLEELRRIAPADGYLFDRRHPAETGAVGNK